MESRFSQEQLKEIWKEIAAGRKVSAVALYRQFSECSLKDAKEGVEAMMASGMPPADAPMTRSVFDAEPSNASRGDLADVIAEVTAIASGGDKIAAIKRWRERTGQGLAEAKHAVEAMMVGRYVPPADVQTASESPAAGATDFDAKVRQLLSAGQKLQAIKLWREQTGASLAEAKSAVERVEAALSSSTPPVPGKAAKRYPTPAEQAELQTKGGCLLFAAATAGGALWLVLRAW